MKCTIIGITGGTGSGKSTFTNRLKNEFPDDVAVIYHDNYYRCQDAIPFEARKKVNYDHPDSLETDLLTEHLKKLKAGGEYTLPVTITLPEGYEQVEEVQATVQLNQAEKTSE